jgi:four helix bundle protein
VLQELQQFAISRRVFLAEPNGSVPAQSLHMSKISSFRDLLVWQKAMDLAVRTYRMAQHLPRVEQTTLGYQLRKTSLSVPSNIAEGFSRHSTATYVRHLWIAHGSGAELETQVEVGRRVELIDTRSAEMLITDAQEVGRMLNGLVNSLERSSSKEPCA